ncbi:class I SAM-dependent methyltransferase [Oleiharenicola sp. Vm1]|uniref:class I SAM-dependent methyltransferase n=1 Tax=Oleiharenicola sp. Vm1 TaxID=3398393 RepID=UPI0039F62D21
MSSPKATTAPTLAGDASRTPSFAARAVLDAFARMPRGQLRVELPDGTARLFGETPFLVREVAPGVANAAVLRVRRERFFSRCVLGGDIGFAEAFIDGDWDTPDLTALIGWFILNLEHAPTLSGSARARGLALNVLRFANRLGHLLRANTRANARRNIAEHYDLSNDFFALWLDDTLMYSAAKWERADATLREAQVAKNDALCRKLHLRRTDHVLEIGTGWGGWSLHAAQHYGCRVTTLTLSRQQRDLAVQRIAAAGLSDRIEVRLQDYRDVTGQFDKIVSIEMLEAVGHEFLPDYAAACARLLKPDGLVALQFITCPDARYDEFRRGVDFIQKHIFPGSLLLSANRLNHLFARAGGFVLHGLEDMGRDYARTLRTWRDGFHQRLDRVRALGFDERFIRKWDYYLAYCEAAFALRNISVVQTVHTRPNNLSF